MKFISQSYSGIKRPLTKDELEKRVLEVVKNYDKINAEKVFIQLKPS